MPPNVNGVPHRRQDRDAGRVERMLLFTTLYVTSTGITGEGGDEAGTGGQVAVPASAQSSLHMTRERLDTVRALTLERERKSKVIPPRGGIKESFDKIE